MEASAFPTTSKVKIVHLIPSLKFGGAEREVAHLCSLLNQHGYPSEVVCLYEGGPFGEFLIKQGIPVRILNFSNHSPFPWRFFHLVSWLRRHPMDIAHVHLVNWATIAARLGGAKAVFLTEHGLSLFKRRHHILFDRFCLLFTNKVITVAKAIRDLRIKRWGIPEEKLYYLPNSIDLKRFDFEIDPIEFKRNLHIPEDDRVVLSVGSLLPVKGHEYLVTASSLILKTVPNTTFLIAGDGSLMDTLQEQARTLGVHQKYKFLGYRKDVEHLLKVADVYVLPSLREGTSLALLEAMASRVPVVATRVGGNPELIEDGISGILVPPRDPIQLAEAIQKLLGDLTLRRRLSARAREVVEQKFSEDHILQKLLSLYRGVLYGSPKTVDH